MKHQLSQSSLLACSSFLWPRADVYRFVPIQRTLLRGGLRDRDQRSIRVFTSTWGGIIIIQGSYWESNEEKMVYIGYNKQDDIRMMQQQVVLLCHRRGARSKINIRSIDTVLDSTVLLFSISSSNAKVQQEYGRLLFGSKSNGEIVRLDITEGPAIRRAGKWSEPHPAIILTDAAIPSRAGLRSISASDERWWQLCAGACN